jgi:hypothetical protein
MAIIMKNINENERKWKWVWKKNNNNGICNNEAYIICKIMNKQ